MSPRLCCAMAGWLLLTTAVAAADKGASTPEALALVIDRHFVAEWKTAGVTPVPPADDAEFLRRVCLDLTGRIPPVTEARSFLDDRRPDKRRRLVDRLLASPAYANHFTNVWSALLLPEAGTNRESRYLAVAFDGWLRQQFERNVGHDKMVRTLLTAAADEHRVNRLYQERAQPDPLAYYVAKGYKAEHLAASTARVFLGVRLECAQCHNHPFATWNREQFWSYAAFFAGFQATVDDEGEVRRARTAKKELLIPGTDRVVQAAFLDGSEPAFKYKGDPRLTLADWMTAADNPYFARAAVNRAWAQLLGSGLVEPVDEIAGSDRASRHAGLLTALAAAFAESHFDWKFLIRAITASRVYQLTSADAPRAAGREFFAAAAVRGLTADQIFDSLAMATGYREDAFLTRLFYPLWRQKFRTLFAASAGNKWETSIPQALALMNGPFVAAATARQEIATLAGIADAPFMDTAQRLETLYLATLSRRPTAAESARLVKLVDGAAEGQTAAAKIERAHALADVFWALLNSSEFILNH